MLQEKQGSYGPLGYYHWIPWIITLILTPSYILKITSFFHLFFYNSCWNLQVLWMLQFVGFLVPQEVVDFTNICGYMVSLFSSLKWHSFSILLPILHLQLSFFISLPWKQKNKSLYPVNHTWFWCAGMLRLNESFGICRLCTLKKSS